MVRYYRISSPNHHVLVLYHKGIVLTVSPGYVIISILIGALIGFALFTRDTLRLQAER